MRKLFKMFERQWPPVLKEKLVYGPIDVHIAFICSIIPVQCQFYKAKKEK